MIQAGGAGGDGGVGLEDWVERETHFRQLWALLSLSNNNCNSVTLIDINTNQGLSNEEAVASRASGIKYHFVCLFAWIVCLSKATENVKRRSSYQEKRLFTSTDHQLVRIVYLPWHHLPQKIDFMAFLGFSELRISL